MTIREVKTQIRFRLNQLKSENRHHDFEHLALALAKQRIARNIIPATGPVSAGGDQGRDFETYKTYLPSLVANNDQSIFFACSITATIVPKIKEDIKSIFDQTEERRPIVYFCEADLPIYKRNKLIKWCKESYEVDLQIFDGQSITEILSDRDVFWIAQEFLNLPADIYPESNDDEEYSKYKDTWKHEENIPCVFADFMQIKYGLRIATFSEKHTIDLLMWLEAMDRLIKNEGVSSELKRRGQYEICVAALRGQNNLNKYMDVFKDYFSDIAEISNPDDLRDRIILMTYGSSAKLQDQFEIDTLTLHKFTVSLAEKIDSFLDKDLSINTRALLLDLKAQTYMLHFKEGEIASFNPSEAINYWLEMIDLVEEAPMYPLDTFCDVLSVLSSFIASEERFDELTDKADILLAKRSGNIAVAHKSRDRAMSFYNNKNYLAAIHHLHKTKINWMSEETIRGCILSVRLIADCYSKLGLTFAAKYYVMSAIYLAFKIKKDDVKDLVSPSFIHLGEILYTSGEWLTLYHIGEIALIAHHHFDEDRLIFDPSTPLGRLFFTLINSRALTSLFWPSQRIIIDEIYNKLAIDDEMRAEFEKITEEQITKLEGKGRDIIWEDIQVLHGRPYNDAYKDRKIHWKALGISWNINFKNLFETSAVCEEFIAILQIILVELSQTDIQVLPISVEINLEVGSSKDFLIKEKHTNDQMIWNLSIPNSEKLKHDNFLQGVVAYASEIVSLCTTMTQNDFMVYINSAFKKGLLEKIFFARPYSDLYKQIMPKKDILVESKTLDNSEGNIRAFEVKEAQDLHWHTDVGVNYNREDSLSAIKERYQRTQHLMSIVWPKIRSTPHLLEFFIILHNEGYKDWHISSIICNAIAGFLNPLTGHDLDRQLITSFKKQAIQRIFDVIDGKRDEDVNKINFGEMDVELMRAHEKMGWTILAQTWGLIQHTHTPNFNALKAILINKYNTFKDDVDHDQLIYLQL